MRITKQLILILLFIPLSLVGQNFKNLFQLHLVDSVVFNLKSPTFDQNRFMVAGSKWQIENREPIRYLFLLDDQTKNQILVKYKNEQLIFSENLSKKWSHINDWFINEQNEIIFLTDQNLFIYSSDLKKEIKKVTLKKSYTDIISDNPLLLKGEQNDSTFFIDEMVNNQIKTWGTIYNKTANFFEQRYLSANFNRNNNLIYFEYGIPFQIYTLNNSGKIQPIIKKTPNHLTDWERIVSNKKLREEFVRTKNYDDKYSISSFKISNQNDIYLISFTLAGSYPDWKNYYYLDVFNNKGKHKGTYFFNTILKGDLVLEKVDSDYIYLRYYVDKHITSCKIYKYKNPFK